MKVFSIPGGESPLTITDRIIYFPLRSAAGAQEKGQEGDKKKAEG
jgi:hypothetical protein